MFTRTLVLACALLWATVAPALAFQTCTSETYYINGRMVHCTRCCYGGQCFLTCL